MEGEQRGGRGSDALLPDGGAAVRERSSAGSSHAGEAALAGCCAHVARDQRPGHTDAHLLFAHSNPTGTAVIIAPGGSYMHLSMQKEGEDVARWLNGRGVAAFVLKYRLGPAYHHPVELGDAQRAIRTVRAQAGTLGLHPDRIGIWGFSAGGHLAASAGTLYDSGPAGSADEIDRQSARPDFLILAYPVITMEDLYVHKGSRQNLLGAAPSAAEIQLLSVEKHVTRETPPAFLFSTTADGTVPVMNSVMFYSALVAAKVPAEMHLYAHGPHGVGLAPGFTDLKGWPDLLATWMRSRSLMAP